MSQRTKIRYLVDGNDKKIYFYSEWIHKCKFEASKLWTVMVKPHDFAVFDGVGILEYSFSTMKKCVEGLQAGGYKLVKTF